MERFEDFYDDINMDDWAEYGDVEGEYEEFEIILCNNLFNSFQLDTV